MNELDLFAAAIAITDSAERGALLDRECTGRPDLRARLDQLLEAHFRSHPLLDQPRPDGTSDYQRRGPGAFDYTPITEKPGSMIGPYKLKEQIGEGGFGLVFVAEQQEPVKRKVALKVIKPGMDTREVMARFDGRAAGAGADGSSEHRAGAGCRGDGVRPAVLRHGVGPRHSHHGLLRSESTVAARPAGLVRHGLPGRAARASKGNHPPRHQAVERAGHLARRQAGGQGHRLRRGQGDQPATDRAHRSTPTSRR